MFTKLKSATAGIALLTFAAPAFAETSINMEVYHLVTETVIIDGMSVEQEVMKPATSSVPGDVLTYRISLDNDEIIAVEDISMVLPLDKNITVLTESVSGSVDLTSLYSVNDGADFGNLADLTVMDNFEERPATTDDLTHIQLLVPTLEAGKNAVVEYSIVID